MFNWCTSLLLNVQTTCSYCKGYKAYLKDSGGPGQAVEEPHYGGGGGEGGGGGPGSVEDQSSLNQPLGVCRQVYSQNKCSLSDVCLCNDTGLSVKEENEFFF